MKSSRSAIFARADLADVAGLAVLIGLSLLFVCGLVMPLAMRARQANAVAEEAARQRQKANALASNIRDAKTELDRIRVQLAASALRIENPSRLNERLSELIAVANEHSLSLSELKPGEATIAKRYTIIPVRLAGTGAFPDATLFLRQLHEKMPDIVLAGFKLGRSPDGATVRGTCELEFRWIARPANEPPADAQVADVRDVAGER